MATPLIGVRGLKRTVESFHEAEAEQEGEEERDAVVSVQQAKTSRCSCLAAVDLDPRNLDRRNNNDDEDEASESSDGFAAFAENVVAMTFDGLEFIRHFLRHPATKLKLEKMKDRENFHPWDYGMRLPQKATSRSTSVIRPTDEAVGTESEVRNSIVNVFLQNNPLEHLYDVMAYHPQYLDCFLTTQRFLLEEDGPLPFPHRHYIAIMAAGRHQCSYLISLHSKEFRLKGGDTEWLKGLRYAPAKLRKLAEVNKILAHQPWRITREHIQQLQRGTDSLSMSEVMQAIVLLAHFHSLSSFVFGCGISAEESEDDKQLRFRSTMSSADEDRRTVIEPAQSDITNANYIDQQVEADNNRIGVLVERMTRLTPKSLTEDEMRERFEKVEKQNAELSAKNRTNPSSAQDDVLRFVDDPNFAYEDFSSCKRACGVYTFRAQDYSWDDHGYSLSNHLYMEVGEILDDKFSKAQNLTYYTMGDHADVDTSSFRCAIWNYIHSLYGIRHDDYDYSVVDQLLERNLKSYIKTVTCFPERVTRRDYDGFMIGFKHSEKVHVNLMLLEARLQAQLLYSLRAISRYMAQGQ